MARAWMLVRVTLRNNRTLHLLSDWERCLLLSSPFTCLSLWSLSVLPLVQFRLLSWIPNVCLIVLVCLLQVRPRLWDVLSRVGQRQDGGRLCMQGQCDKIEARDIDQYAINRKWIAHFFICSKCTLKGFFFQVWIRLSAWEFVKCRFIVIATIVNTEKYCPEYSQERIYMLEKYAESIKWQTQAQHATTDGHTDLKETFLSNTNTM